MEFQRVMLLVHILMTHFSSAITCKQYSQVYLLIVTGRSPLHAHMR